MDLKLLYAKILLGSMVVAGTICTSDLIAQETLDEILAKHIEAIGGVDAHKKQTTRRIEGVIVFPDPRDPQRKVTITQKAPNLRHCRIVKTHGIIDEVFDGKTAWKYETGEKLASHSEGPVFEEQKIEADFYSAIKLKTLYSDLSYEGRETVAGTVYNVLKGARNDGQQVIIYLNAKSHFIERMKIPTAQPKHPYRIIEMRDYRAVDGVKMPFIITTKDLTRVLWTLRIDKVTHGVTVDDDLFKPFPPELQVLDRFSGLWKTSPDGLERTNRHWLHNGRGQILQEMITSSGKPSGMGGWIYDAQNKRYRVVFMNLEYGMMMNGTWDEQSQTMQWMGYNDKGFKYQGRTRFVDRDNTVWEGKIVDGAGTVWWEGSGKNSRIEIGKKVTKKQNPLFKLIDTGMEDLRTLTASRNGTRLLVGARGNKVTIINTITSQKKDIKLPDRLKTAAISPDGKTAAVAVQGGKILLFALDNATPKVTVLRKHGRNTRVLSYFPDGKRLIIGGYDKKIEIWDTVKQKELIQKGIASIPCSLAVSPDRKSFACGVSNGEILLLNATDLSQLATLKGHKFAVKAIDLSSDGSQILSGSDDLTLRLWTKAGKHLHTFTGHTSLITGATFLADGKRIVSSSMDGALRTWDLQTGKELQQWDVSLDGLWGLSPMTGRTGVLSAARNGKIYLMPRIPQ